MGKLECVNSAIDQAKKLLGEQKATRRRLKDIADDIESRARGYRRRNPDINYEESYRTASKAVLDEHEADIKAQERAVQFQKPITMRNWSRLERNNFSKESLMSFLDSIEGKGEGYASSLNGLRAAQEEILCGDKEGWIDKLLTRTDAEGKILIGKFMLSANHETICQAVLDTIEENAEALDRTDADIKKIAKIIVDKNERERNLLNERGGNVPRNRSRIARTRWNPMKMRQMGFEDWLSFEGKLVDYDRTFPDLTGDDLVKAMRRHYDDMTTGIGNDDMPESHNDEMGFTKFYRSLHKRRVFYFKDGASWLKHQMTIGDTDLVQSLQMDTVRTAKELAMLKQFGPYAHEQFNILRKTVIKKGNMINDGSYDRRLNAIFKDIDGSTSLPANYTVARIFTNLRRVDQWSSMGLTTFSSLPDLALMIRTLTYNGVKLGDAQMAAMRAFAEVFAPGLERKEFYELLNLGCRDALGNQMRFDPNSVAPGMMSNLDRLYYRLNLLQRWDKILRSNTAAVLMRNLANNAAKPWAALDFKIKRNLTRALIGEGEWDVMRKNPVKLISGMEMVGGEGAKLAPKEHIISYLNKPDASAAEIKFAREEINDRFLTFLEDQMQHVILNSSPTERVLLTLGTERGTVAHEVLRYLTMYMTYPVAFARRIIGRELLGTAGLGETMRGLAQVFAYTTLLSTVSYSASALLRGRRPDLTNHYVLGRIASASFGRYGDMMFSILGSSPGNASITDILGGGARTSADAYRTLVKVLSFNQNRPHRLSALWHFAKYKIPFANMWFINGLFRHYILDSISDLIDPGSVARSQRYITQLTGETPLFQ